MQWGSHNNNNNKRSYARPFYSTKTGNLFAYIENDGKKEIFNERAAPQESSTYTHTDTIQLHALTSCMANPTKSCRIPTHLYTDTHCCTGCGDETMNMSKADHCYPKKNIQFFGAFVYIYNFCRVYGGFSVVVHGISTEHTTCVDSEAMHNL